jgi:hypothetical protein
VFIQESTVIPETSILWISVTFQSELHSSKLEEYYWSSVFPVFYSEISPLFDVGAAIE